MYTIVFILVTILILIGLSLFGLLISKLDRWIDRKERLGSESIVKNKSELVNKNSNDISENSAQLTDHKE